MNGEPNGNGMTATVLRTVGAGLIVVLVTGLGGRVLYLAEEMSRLRAEQAAHERRLESLEVGRTTPMAAETRAQFESIRRELESLRNR